MIADHRSDLELPAAELTGDDVLQVPTWAQMITLLWGLARARTGRLETARYREVRGELGDIFDEYLGRDHSAYVSVSAIWLTMGESTWWSTDLRPPDRYTPADVEEFNSTGGLSPAAVDVARDDVKCGAVVLGIVQAIPFEQGLETVLGILDFDRFVEFRTAESRFAMWPGLLDIDAAAGSHELADAASGGEWDRVLRLLDRQGGGGANTWRPGGVSWSTPLHQAARHGAPAEVVAQLLDRGAWRGLPDAAGLLPLDIAIRTGHAELAELLAPPEVTPTKAATLRALEEFARTAIIEHSTNSGLLRVPRFRTPSLRVLDECGGVLGFDLGSPGLAIYLWVVDDELFVAHWWDGAELDGSVRVYGPEGERRDLPWDGSFLGHSPDVEGLDSDDAAIESAEQSEQNDDDHSLSESAREEKLESPRYSGSRILVGTSRRFGPLYVLGPRSKSAELHKRPEANTKAIGIAVRRTDTECAWAVLGRGWRHTLPSLHSDTADGGWTELILFCALFKRNALSDRVTAMAEFWAATGEDPLGASEFTTPMREGLSEVDYTAVADRWRQFAVSMTNHDLAPTGAFGTRDRGGRSGDVPELAAAAMESVRNPPTVGTPTEFENALPMRLQTSTASADGRWNGESMLVLEGSRAALESQPKFGGSSAELRSKLLDAGKLVRHGDGLIFAMNHRFSSPSAAASVLCGSSQNGRELWFDSDGRNINDIEGGVKFVRTRG